MISVVVPAYNEEKSIKTTITEIKKVLKNSKLDKGSEIIIVDDGSTDDTSKIAEKCGAKVIRNCSNMGYGFSLKRGITEAKNETIVITDADMTYPFDVVPKMIEKKNEGFDLVVAARTGKYYRQGLFKSFLRLLLKILVQFVADKKIKDVNSGLRVFDKTLVMKYYPRLCNTFSFTTSQTLAYFMNNHFVTYIDIKYKKRVGKSKIRLFRDSLISMKYILESCIYYNPLKLFSLLSFICILASIICFIVSHFVGIHAAYILGIGCLLISIIVFSLGMIAVLLKQIMDKD